MHKNYSIQIGLGQYQNGRRLTATFYDDNFTYYPYSNAAAYYYFYQVYALYDLRLGIADGLDGHISNGIMLLHSRDKAEIFYVTEPDNSYPFLGKIGLIVKITKPVYKEIIGMFVKGLTNILTKNSTGEYIHSAIDAKIRTEYRW